MSSYFEEQIQRNDRNKRRRRSFVQHRHLIETVSAERHSQYHPNPLPLSSPSQSPTPLSMASQTVYSPGTSTTSSDSHDTPTRRRGKRKQSDPTSVTSPPHHIMAHRLNNLGVQCIHSGQYEEAIYHLFGAIKVIQTGDTDSKPRATSLSVILQHHFANSSSSLTTPPRNSPGGVDERDDMNTSRDRQLPCTMDSGFIYSQAILVPSDSRAEHATGQAFQVILSFNMALANHLSWATRKDTSDTKRLDQIVQLYEVACHLASRIHVNRLESEDANLCKMRFTLAIINNLTQIHRDLNSDNDHRGVLENLLSHLMVVATVQQQYSSLNRQLGNATREGSDERQATGTEIKLDGFFHNVLPLILKNNSAEAA